MDPLGDQLVEILRGARQECLLAAPYIKCGALSKVLGAIDSSCHIRMVTRWRIEEIAAGVSDIEIWPLLCARGNADLWLQPVLHAKYYRANEQILIGSANLTDAALGWGFKPNLEILESPRDGFQWRNFERVLLCGATPVTDELFQAFASALEAFPKPPLIASPIPHDVPNGVADWRPSLRFPEDLFSYYAGNLEALTSAAREAAARDLATLQPPNGLSSTAFKSWIGLAILQNVEFRAIDALVDTSRRFGEMRELLAGRGAGDASRAWQTWMRWILHFLPQHFAFHTANYSEIVSRRESTSRSGAGSVSK